MDAVQKFTVLLLPYIEEEARAQVQRALETPGGGYEHRKRGEVDCLCGCSLWRVACGVWCVVRGVWRVVRGAWCVVRGAWCVVRGAWCVVRGAWCVVRAYTVP